MLTAPSSVTVYADPYLACHECRQRAAGYTADRSNWPCGHRAGATSICPSWSPVDGCRCAEQLGARNHGEPPLPGGYVDPIAGRNR